MNAQLNLILKFVIDSHQYFAEQIWPKNPKAIVIENNNQRIVPSYHSQFHIQSVVAAADNIVKSALAGNDPLQIISDLRKWSDEQHLSIVETEFLTSNLIEIFKLSFATHDLGNITQSSQLIVKNQEIKLDFADSFQLEAGIVEQRSADLANQLIDHYFPQDFNHQDLIKKLVDHLIMQTVFNPTQSSSDEPFWLSAQFIDQIASHFFSEADFYQATAGYLNELYVGSNIGQRQPMSLRQFLNFVPQRFEILIPDQQQQQQLKHLLDQADEKGYIWQLSHNIPDRPINYKHDILMIFNFSNSQ